MLNDTTSVNFCSDEKTHFRVVEQEKQGQNQIAENRADDENSVVKCLSDGSLNPDCQFSFVCLVRYPIVVHAYDSQGLNEEPIWKLVFYF